MQLPQILTEFKTEIAKIYENNLKNVILYGSYARNEETVDSDIDVLVVIGGEIKEGLEIDRMIDVIYEINLKYNVLISVVPMSEKEYNYILKCFRFVLNSTIIFFLTPFK